MRRMKKLILILGVAGALNFSCTGMITRSLRDAVLAGVSGFLTEFTTDTLNNALSGGG